MTIAKVLLRPAAPAAIALTMGAHLPVDQAQGQGIGPEVFGGLVEACSMDRKPLKVRVITQSVYDGANVEWVEGGWVALEEGTGDLLLLNDAAELAERWGRTHSGLEGPPLILGGARVGRLEQTGLVFMDKQGAYPVLGSPIMPSPTSRGRSFTQRPEVSLSWISKVERQGPCCALQISESTSMKKPAFRPRDCCAWTASAGCMLHGERNLRFGDWKRMARRSYSSKDVFPKP